VKVDTRSVTLTVSGKSIRPWEYLLAGFYPNYGELAHVLA